MSSYTYTYTKNNIKFLNLFHDFIKSQFSKDFYINNEDNQFTFVFNEELDDTIKLQLDKLIEFYTPEQSYFKLIRSQPLNISTCSTNSTDYICLANSVYNLNTIGLKLSTISIISNIVTPDNLGTYQIRIYDSISNNIIWESDVLNNTLYTLIEPDELDNIPTTVTIIEIQMKVSNFIYSANIKAINFNFKQLVQ